MINSTSFFQEYKEQSIYIRRKQSFRQTNLRYVALFFACMIMLGDAYCFDNPMAIQYEIKSLFGINNFRFNLLYTVYSLPNIILPFFGGILIDKIGPRQAILLFSSIIIIGQIICIWGAYSVNYWLLIAGRIIFGAGSENLNVSQNAIMAEWFKHREMSLAIGLCISIPKIGNAINSLITPQIYSVSGNIYTPMIAGLGMLIFSFACALVLIYMDLESDRREKHSTVDDFLISAVHGSSLQNSAHVQDISKTRQKVLSRQDITRQDIDNKLDSPDLSRDFDDEEVWQFEFPDKMNDSPGDQQGEHEIKEEINLRDIAKMSGTFWVLVVICTLTEALFVPFLDNGNDLFQERYLFTSQEAGIFLVIPYLVAAFLTAFLGIIADNFGRRGYLIILTSITFLITHILFTYIVCDGVCGVIVLPLFMLGLCFAFYASIVIGSIPIVVKSNLVGTAFGLAAVFQNSALAVFPLITGMIFTQFSVTSVDGHETPDAERGYTFQSYFFVGMSLLLLCVSFLLVFMDRKGDNKLNAKGTRNKHNLNMKVVEQFQLASSFQFQ